jgi:hypothetical protein
MVPVSLVAGARTTVGAGGKALDSARAAAAELGSPSRAARRAGEVVGGG